MKFAYPRQTVGVAFAGSASSPPLPCDRCIGRTLNLCKPLDSARLRHLMALGTMQRWKHREILFRAGDPMSSFFKIREGVVAVSRTLDDGRRQIVAVRSAGECVGYLESEGRYAFEGHALTEVQACAFDRRGFDAMIADNPDLAAALAEALSQALTQSAQSILVMGKLRSIERVAHFLAEMVLVHRHSHTNSGPLHLHMSRTEIADYLGLTVETVSRSIGKLKKRSVISLVDSDEVIVLNDSLLREIGKTDNKH